MDRPCTPTAPADRRAAVRALVATAAATPLAGFAAPATATAEDPLVELERAWLDLDERAGLEDDELGPTYARDWTAALAAIAGTPARTVAGLAVKARMVRREIAQGHSGFHEALAGGLVADAERLAAGDAHV